MGNPYINTHDEDEQYLVQDLVDEAIEIHSEQFYYIPRKLFSYDEIFGEDRLSKFEHAYPFDGYLENQSGFEGQGFLIQKFGAMLDYTANITISRRQWEKMIARFGETLIPTRPCEGDLIYYPATDGLFEIKFVDDKNPFMALGKFYTFKMTIELFQYNSEVINTENPDIDIFESLRTLDRDADKSVWGGIERIIVEDGGYGYTDIPFVYIESLTGADAEFFVQLDDNGSIEVVEVLCEGQGYHSEDILHIDGDCEREAILHPVIRTITENTGDNWGSNKVLVQSAFENTVFDPENPFGEDEDGR